MALIPLIVGCRASEATSAARTSEDQDVQRRLTKSELKPHLIVALTSAAMRYRYATLFLGDFDLFSGTVYSKVSHASEARLLANKSMLT